MQPSTSQPCVPSHDPAHDARDLMHGATQTRIQLDEKIYTLSITRAGKLILTK